MLTDDVHIPIGVGDYLLKQMFSRASADRKITVSTGGNKLFKGIVVTLQDCDEDAKINRAVIFQDLEHIGWILDDMEYELNDLVKEE